MEETQKHICDPKRMKGKDTSVKQPKVSDSFKKDVNKLSYDELKKKYKGLISSQNSYQGTGYGYVVRSLKQLLEDQFVMKRYRELKREVDAKQAAYMSELNKYHYLNLYKHIQEIGRRPDGTPATELEKKIVPFVVSIGNLFEAGKGFAVAASGYAAYQNYYGKPILGVDTNWLGQQKVTIPEKVIVQSNLGNQIEITPTDNHSVVQSNPGPFGGEPNSSVDIVDAKTDELLTRRFYDSNGRAFRDIDFTHHGNIKTHPDAPHEHFWKYDPNGNVIGRQ